MYPFYRSNHIVPLVFVLEFLFIATRLSVLSSFCRSVCWDLVYIDLHWCKEGKVSVAVYSTFFSEIIKLKCVEMRDICERDVASFIHSLIYPFIHSRYPTHIKLQELPAQATKSNPCKTHRPWILFFVTCSMYACVFHETTKKRQKILSSQEHGQAIYYITLIW